MKHGNYSDFISGILGNELAVTTQGISLYIPPLLKFLETGIIESTERDPLKLLMLDENHDFFDGKDDITADSLIAIIPIRGHLSKYGCWWCYGTEDYAMMLKEAYADDRIKAIVLQVDSPGGQTDSAFVLESALAIRNKPVITAVDSLAASAAYYIGCLTDKIIAVDRMARVGSIGVMAMIIDDRKMLKDIGIKIIEIIPPESKWKNKPHREAKDGKTQLLIKEALSPWAVNFQDHVKKHRPGLTEETEGILEGRMFYAYDALENGLIDSILTFDEIIEYAFNYKLNNEMNSIINS